MVRRRGSFQYEFGRPNLGGYFRTFEESIDGEMCGYHKPIMIAGGLGTSTLSTAQNAARRARS
jgi:phosphoribosylformylglycinamidine (FGAM) synthase-like enzyme